MKKVCHLQSKTCSGAEAENTSLWSMDSTPQEGLMFSFLLCDFPAFSWEKMCCHNRISYSTHNCVLSNPVMPMQQPKATWKYFSNISRKIVWKISEGEKLIRKLPTTVLQKVCKKQYSFPSYQLSVPKYQRTRCLLYKNSWAWMG